MPSLVMTILIAVFAADLLWWRLADRQARRWRRARWWRLLIGLFMGGQIAVLLWALAGRGLAASLGSPPQPLMAAAYLWHLALLPAACTLAAAGALARGAWEGGRRVAGWAVPRRWGVSPAPAPAPAEAPATRRQFLGAVATAAPALLTGAGVAYSRAQLGELRVRPLSVALPGLPRELDGLRIALVSDLHVGTFTSSRDLKRIVEETSRLDADLVLLPGDLINNALADLPAALDAVCNMQSRHGAFLSIGNHDLIEDGGEFVRRVKARVPLLVSESRVVPVRGQLVQLLGLPWGLDDARIASSVREVARQLVPGAFPVLLAHHPHAFDAAAAAGLPLTVSGHTHGGQLMLSDAAGFGPLMFRYWSGLYRKPGPKGAALVVSNGAGNWFPLRTAAPAEIIDLTLRSPRE